MDQSRIRAWRWHKQGLDGRLQGRSPAGILESTGWARSVGGAGPYLTLFARGGTGREQVDRAAATLEIQELPAARGCTYVVPATDCPLALLVGRSFTEVETRQARTLGMTDGELDRLCDAVIRALENGPLEVEALRTATGDASRSLGEEGRKKGLATTLPVALGRLQSMGEIRRVPINGRLDQQRYRYALWRPNPAAGFTLSLDEAHAELARRYFSWIGPASLEEFRWFSGLGVKASKAAVAGLRLSECEGRSMLAKDREQFDSFSVPKEPAYVLTSGLDGLCLLRRDVPGGNQVAGVQDLSNHAIWDRGTLAGLWDYDPAAESIVWTAFVPKDAALTKAVKQTEEFVRVDLGDARSFSLDSPKSRVPRLEALRRLAEGSNAAAPEGAGHQTD